MDLFVFFCTCFCFSALSSRGFSIFLGRICADPSELLAYVCDGAVVVVEDASGYGTFLLQAEFLADASLYVFSRAQVSFFAERLHEIGEVGYVDRSFRICCCAFWCSLGSRMFLVTGFFCA